MVLFGCATGGEDTSGGATSRPNIILIMADDVGYEALSANGGHSYATPHLDRLAATGLRFDRAFSQPLCTPSRVQIMTGLYNFRNYREFGILAPGERTFGNMLRDAGYATGVVGKWQLQEASDRDMPHEVGFDEYLLWQLGQGDYWHRYKDPILVGHDTERDTIQGAYGPDLFASFAEDFISRHRDEPFFLYYPMALPHRPFQPTPDQPAFDDYPVESLRDTSYFGDMVTYMDKIVGRIRDKVEDEGLHGETLILFTSDNGAHWSITSRYGQQMIRGDKGRTTRAGMHVPLIAHWPGTIAPGSTRELINFTDFVPTLADVAEVSPEKRMQTDGISFYSTLRGREESRRAWMFVDYRDRKGTFPERRFTQDETYKLYNNGEFYNYMRDPSEENPLTKSDMSARAVRARTKLSEALEMMNQEVQNTLKKAPAASEDSTAQAQ
jgi:arylsulfatase A-like enzyme